MNAQIALVFTYGGNDSNAEVKATEKVPRIEVSIRVGHLMDFLTDISDGRRVNRVVKEGLQ